MNLSLYFHTLKYLRWQQIWYRLSVLKRLGRKVSSEILDFSKAGKVVDWRPSIASYSNYTASDAFTFLNESHSFSEAVDWDCLERGLLWTYNLNYFEFLVQEELPVEEAFRLMQDYQQRYSSLKIGHDPYPISLRLIFWIRFFCKISQVPSQKQLLFLHQQAKELQSKLEYHILGNHLLENAFALFMSGCFLRDQQLYKQGQKLLNQQLKEQILPDGGHFELSPMYHQLMLYRLLDCINLCRSTVNDRTYLEFLENYASKMLGWLKNMSFQSGGFPLFNDAANGIAPTPKALVAYADRLNITTVQNSLNASGYRKWEGENWELIFDIGKPGPSYQPGHAHCDIFNFELHINGQPLIVDTGTSVYGGNTQLRQSERSTASHNTVQIEDLEQSEIWSDFRMGRRARVKVLIDQPKRVRAAMWDYLKSYQHQRTFEKEENKVILTDKLKTKKKTQIARFHLHPAVEIAQVDSNSFRLNQSLINFENAIQIKENSYTYAPEFGERLPAKVLEIYFLNDLCTSITF